MMFLLLLRVLLADLLLGGLAVVRDLLLVILHVGLHLLEPLLLERGQLILGHGVLAGEVLQFLLAHVTALDSVLKPLIFLLQLPDELVSGILIDNRLGLNLLGPIS